MKDNNEQLILDQEGYDQLLEEIEVLKQKIAQNNLEKSEAYSGATGDGWHDNFAFEEANRQERLLLGMLRDKYFDLKRATIVNNMQDSQLAEIGDILTTKVVYSPDDSEELVFKLVSILSSLNKENNSLKEISITSPLGKSVYQKSIGDTTNYVVNDRKFLVEILNIEKVKGLEKGHSKTR